MNFEVTEAQGGFGGYGGYGTLRFDATTAFGSNYATPGWQRAQAKGGGSSGGFSDDGSRYAADEENPASYGRIRDVVRLAAPFFDDFQLRTNPLVRDMIQLEWRQKNSDYPFLSSQLSDGTLRFICLATALLQPSPPATMVFDEPELGLHPYALTLLASLLDVATKRHLSTSDRLDAIGATAERVRSGRCDCRRKDSGGIRLPALGFEGTIRLARGLHAR